MKFPAYFSDQLNQYLEKGVLSHIAGHKEVEERPEIEYVVLYGRARQHQAVIGVYLLHRHGELRLMVLNHVPLV